MSDLLPRLIAFRRRASLVLLALAVIAYPIARKTDPYVFGFLFLGFAPIQLGVAGLGILARLTRRDRNTASTWVIDILLLASALAAAIAVKSISWT